MKIAVLTSSRADYSIYLPLLKAIKKSSKLDLKIIVFGTHLIKEYGNTVEAIRNDGFEIIATVDSIKLDDSPASITKMIGETIVKFSSIWEQNKFDLVFALGDRFEMFAAVSSTVPFNINVAHLHGGETTLGAIDNCFRHAITLMSKYHFTCAEDYKKRVIEIIGTSKNVYNVGALSFDNFKNLTLLNQNEFETKFGINISKPSVLITYHPETIDFKKNEQNVDELVDALSSLKNYQLIITMPNADTTGIMVRNKINQFIASHENAIGIESFGTIGYLTCMKFCKFMLGNTSSGFVEAAYFATPVINLGLRQKGRIVTPNILNVEEITAIDILNAIKNIETKSKHLKPITIYGNGNTSQQIKQILESEI